MRESTKHMRAHHKYTNRDFEDPLANNVYKEGDMFLCFTQCICLYRRDVLPYEEEKLLVQLTVCYGKNIYFMKITTS